MDREDGLRRRAGATPWGAKLRAIRRQQRLSQAELAERLGVSASYLNLIENDKRPLPASLLLKLATEVGVDLQHFVRDDDARLEGQLLEAFSDPLFQESPLTNTDLRELVSANPNIARAVRTLYDAYLDAKSSADSLAARLFDDDQRPGVERTRSPSEDVNDFIQARWNHFADLEYAAERLWRDAELDADNLYRGLARYLERAHHVRVALVQTGEARGTLRRYDPAGRTLWLSELLPTRSRTFQLAHQIGLFETESSLSALTEDPTLSTEEARALARVALANYYAGAVLMPYGPFFKAAESERYDIDVVGRRFRVGFEQVAHRFTTLRRPGSEGVPFHMIRIDVAGNISKRFSGSGIRFARFSGACPRWNVFSAFLTPGRIALQVSAMPGDKEKYFCLARTIQKDASGFHQRQPVQALGLGCSLEHASKLIYSDGMNLTDNAIVVPVGVTCRMCERDDCSERAHPSLREPLQIDANVRRQSLYMPSRGPSRGK
ncbi:MAG: DUF2083 domain-containing protein [Myxococcales bacterium]|nr:DUF2083 domain-containing protein [Myxococcales bacterium]